jgi:hypothetical protein
MTAGDWAALIVAGLGVVVGLCTLIPVGDKAKKRLPWIAASVASLAIGIGVGNNLVVGEPDQDFPIERTARSTSHLTVAPSSSMPEVAITYPVPGQPTVDACFSFSFTATPPAGWTFVVANRRYDERTMLFEGDLDKDIIGRHWSAPMMLDLNDESATGKLYYLMVVMLPVDVANYLVEISTDPKAHKTWWKSKDLPPGAIMAPNPTEVRRSSKATCE